MQFECADRTLDAAWQAERTMNAFGGDARKADQLFRADLLREFGVRPGPLPDSEDERQVQQVHLQANLIGDAHQRRL